MSIFNKSDEMGIGAFPIKSMEGLLRGKDMAAERRENERISLSRDYFFFPGKEKKKIECMLKNVSITGACIFSKVNIKKDDIIYLHIRGSKEIVLKSKVVWKIGDQYGLLFILDTSQDFDNISYIMNFELKEINA